jgi:hypothetical protein
MIKTRSYFTADQLFEKKTQCAITIQCFVRQVQARLRTRKLLIDKKEKLRAYQEVNHLTDQRRKREGKFYWRKEDCIKMKGNCTQNREKISKFYILD